MNEARVKKLAQEGSVEFTRKMFKRFMKEGVSLAELVNTISHSECKDEDIFSSPDFTFQMGLPARERDGDCVCVQSSEGKTIRVVGYIRKSKPKSSKRSSK
jgi:hypothetical protein